MRPWRPGGTITCSSSGAPTPRTRYCGTASTPRRSRPSPGGACPLVPSRFARSAPVHTRRILLAARSIIPSLFARSAPARTHSRHPPPWPGHSFLDGLFIMLLYTLAASSSLAWPHVPILAQVSTLFGKEWGGPGGRSPHQHGLLASGGGTADRCIRVWNTTTNTALSCVDTGSQVCNLVWSKNVNELVSTHGYSQNQIIVWRYPTMSKLATLTGHTLRVLYLAISPDGQTIVTGAGDETLRFWNVFPAGPGPGPDPPLVAEPQPHSRVRVHTRRIDTSRYRQSVVQPALKPSLRSGCPLSPPNTACRPIRDTGKRWTVHWPIMDHAQLRSELAARNVQMNQPIKSQ